MMKILALFLFCTFTAFGAADLEVYEGQRILHLTGTPYELGYQHGSLLKSEIQATIAKYIDGSNQSGPQTDRIAKFQAAMPSMLKYIPAEYLEEMKGLAIAAEVPFEKILVLNLFPEMFHCSAIALKGDATKKGELYHVRVLDYSIGKNLQSTAVLMDVKPDGRHRFFNVSYAGFIGSVTGMNSQKIALGEIGGKGYGNWDGMPMSFLMRQVLEKASTLEEAKEIFSNSPRTCEYYYLISDGNTKDAVGVYATPSQIQFFPMGEPYAILAPKGLPKLYDENGVNDKFIVPSFKVEKSAYQAVIRDSQGDMIALFHGQPKDALVMIGFAHPERYPVFMDRLMENYGKVDAYSLQDMIKRPVVLPSNLHNAIFCPAELTVWVSHAGPNDEVACDQPYVPFIMMEE